jgi:hypothetical protein
MTALLDVYSLYSWFRVLISGGLKNGSPAAYAHGLWIISVLLSFTFPIIGVYAIFFNFWLLTEYAFQARPMDNPV